MNNHTVFRIVGHVDALYYSSGQAASLLGVSLATVRLLCENGVIKAEKTPGGQWRIPKSEVERLLQEGLPVIPRPLPIEAAPDDDASEPRAPSDAVVIAQDEVDIARSTLERRRIERDIEENEDWFHERQRQREAAAALERQKANARLAEHQRNSWIQKWTKYALDSVPHLARNEVEVEVHAAVKAVLSGLQTFESDTITHRLVDAAVRKALRPWQRKQDMQAALSSAMNGLPWDIRNKSEWASVKQRTWDSAVKAIQNLREDASYPEMLAAAKQVVQPVTRAFEQAEAYDRIVRFVYVYDATPDELEAAKNAVRQGLEKLPLGATSSDMEKAKEAALQPYKAAVEKRKETARLEFEKQLRRRAAASRVDGQLNHIERYLREEYVFDGGEADLREGVDRLRPVIRATLIDRVLQTPQLNDAQIRAEIERLVDDD